MAGCGPVRKSKRGKWRATVLISVHVLIAAHLAHWYYSGTTLTPVEPSESMQTLELGLLNCGFILFAASLLLTMVFGRFFCGWACHLLALQDLSAWLLGKLGLRPKPVRSRLLAWVPLGAALYMFVWPTLERMLAGRPAPKLEAHLTTSDFWATFPGPVASIMTFLVTGFVVVWWLGSKGFCTYGCPYGGFFAIADRTAPGRILVNDNCDGCAHCTATCTSNVRVHEEVAKFKMVVDAGCMKCLDCVNVCPKEALRFGFAKPALGDFPKRTYSFTWGEELAMAVAFTLTLLSVRGLYGVIPFLLSLALGVLGASIAIALWRLARRPMVAWQHHLLKKNGRLTRSGVLAATAMTACLGLFAHSGVVQILTWQGGRLLAEAKSTADMAEQDALCEASKTAWGWAERLGFTVDHRVQVALAELQSRESDYRGAEARLRRALEAKPRDLAARLKLANIVAVQGRLRDAEAILVDLLDRESGFVPAQVRLEALRRQIRAVK